MADETPVIPKKPTNQTLAALAIAAFLPSGAIGGAAVAWARDLTTKLDSIIVKLQKLEDEHAETRLHELEDSRRLVEARLAVLEARPR